MELWGAYVDCLARTSTEMRGHGMTLDDLNQRGCNIA